MTKVSNSFNVPSKVFCLLKNNSIDLFIIFSLFVIIQSGKIGTSKSLISASSLIDLIIWVSILT